jgi:hypothetical protein
LEQILAKASSVQGNLVRSWRTLANGRKKTGPAPAPNQCVQGFRDQLQRWLTLRELHEHLRFSSKLPDNVPSDSGWLFFQYHPRTSLIKAGPEWEHAFHGTWWYALWTILEHGVVLESNNEKAGHDFWDAGGVYCSPKLETAREYARPQQVFEDGAYHRVVLDLLVDMKQLRRKREKGGQQWTFPSQAVFVRGVLFQQNSPPQKGDERLDDWEPCLEALPDDVRIRPPRPGAEPGPGVPAADEIAAGSSSAGPGLPQHLPPGAAGQLQPAAKDAEPGKFCVIVRSRPLRKPFSGSPPDLCLDVTEFKDPHADASLRQHCGRHWQIQRGIQDHDGWEAFLTQTHRAVQETLAYAARRQSSHGRVITIDVCCNHGKHRSVAVAELLSLLVAEWPGVESKVLHWNTRLCQCRCCVHPSPTLVAGTYRLWTSLGNW